jgi:electron transport complex protein RnfG
VIVAGLLGFVNSITKDRIEAINQEKTNASLAAVFKDASSPKFPKLDTTDDMTAAAAKYSATLESVYEVQDSGSTIGYAIKITASGSQGDIEMVVGVDMDQAVTGVSIVNNSETSGIGSKIMNNNALPSGTGVLDQFAGKSHTDGDLTVGKNVDAISGATVSTRGVTKGVNGALAVAQTLLG